MAALPGFSANFLWWTQSLEKTRVLEDCCSGYARTADNSSCVPICAQQCLHGTWYGKLFFLLISILSSNSSCAEAGTWKLRLVFSLYFYFSCFLHFHILLARLGDSVGPDNCKCEPGYGGPTCNIGMRDRFSYLAVSLLHFHRFRLDGHHWPPAQTS